MKNLAGIKKYNCELNKAIKESLIDALYLLLKDKSKNMRKHKTYLRPTHILNFL